MTHRGVRRYPLYASSGVLAFIGSLIYFAYFFVTIAPGPSTAEVLPALLANVALFTLFAAHHSLMARSGAKHWLARHLPPEVERTTYVWVASLLFVATCACWRELPGTVYAASGVVRGVGLSLQAGGLVIIALSVAVLDPLELAGIRSARDPDAALRIRGPYRWVRHPIYLGWVLVIFGSPDMPATRLAFAVISTTYLVVAIPWEERSMSDTFGDTYRRYRARVTWRVLPGVW